MAKMNTIPKRFLPAATVATLGAAMGFIIAPIESLYITSLGANGLTLGIIYALGSLLLIIFTLWFGHLADKGHRQRLIFLGLSFAIIYPFLYANVINALQYAGVKPLWAIAGVATGPLLLGYIQDTLVHTKKKGVWFGYYYAAASLIGAFGHFIGGYLAQNIGLQAPYVAIGVLAIINILIAFFFLKPVTPTTKTEETFGRLPGFKYFFTHPPLLFYLIANTAIGLNFGIKYLLWPLIIFGISNNNTITGSIFATMGVAAFLVLITSRYWADRFRPYKILFGSLVLLIISGFFISSTQELFIFWIAAAFFALGEAIAGPSEAVLLTEHVNPAMRGRILAADDTMDKTLASLSPLLAGGLLTIFNAQQVFLVYVVITCIALVANLFLYTRKLQPTHDPTLKP